MAGKNMKTVSFTIPLEIVQKLTTMANMEYRSLSSYMRIVLAKHIEKLEETQGEIAVEEIVKSKKQQKENPEPKKVDEANKPKLVSRLRKKSA